MERTRLAYARLAFRTLLFVGIPAYVAMRIGAEWIYSKEGWADVPNEPGWLGIGYITADLGGLCSSSPRSSSPASARAASPRPTAGRASWRGRPGVLTIVVLAAYLVAVWAMTAKPT